MKPTFALDLTRDKIALLHRTPKGWLSIGEVAFDAPDLAEALDYLRKTALGLSPMGLACKVILPNNQLLYTEIHAPGPSREDKRRQISAALVGRTPYPVEDLVFDWSGKGSVVRVAVVARETLDEAESFAVSHRLNPVSFVAIPEDGTFFGEAWFGATTAADTILAPGETVERDREAVSILKADPPSPTIAGSGAGSAAGSAPEDSLPGLEEALSADVTEADLAAAQTVRPESPALDLPFDDPADGPADEPTDEPIDELEPVDFVPLREQTLSALVPDGLAADPPATSASLPPPPPAPVDVFVKVAVPEPVAPPSLSDPEEAPFADVAEEADPQDPPAVAASAPRVLAPDILDDDIPPAPSTAAMLAFSSRRSASAAPSAPSPAQTPAPAGRVDPPALTPRPSAPIARPVVGEGSGPIPGLARPQAASAAVTAPTIPGLRPKPKPKVTTGEIPRPVAPGPVTVKSPARPTGTFGSPPTPRRRSGMTFMILIGLLLLSLALVAAWASFFLTQADSDTGASLSTDVIEVPAVEDEMAADMIDPADFAEAEPEPAALPDAGEAADLAALAVEEMPVNLGGDDSGIPPTESVAETMAETALPGDPAAGTEADTAGTEPVAETATETATDTEAVTEAGADEPLPGSTIATEVSGRPAPVEDQDEIFLAAMDAPPPILDALALPAPTATTDAPPAAPMPPPAPGTVYQFDDRGLLMPTPEGILSPEGIMLFAGQPPLVPPARSPAAEAAAAAVAATQPAPDAVAGTETVTTAADASLVTAGEEAAVLEATPEVAAEEVIEIPADPALAGFRPKPRPPTLVVPDDGASLETGAETEVVTLRPLARPASVTAAAEAVAPTSAVADLGAQGASLAAQAEALAADAAALEAANPSIVAISMRPAARPDDLSRAVEAAVAAAVREPDPAPEAEVELAAATPSDGEAVDEPEPEDSAPSIPTKASVAKQATYDNAINLSKINLIGTFGTSSSPYALIRQANGKYKKVEVGDKIDGGVVKAITENEVRYQKGGKLVSLKMPKA